MFTNIWLLINLLSWLNGPEIESPCWLWQTEFTIFLHVHFVPKLSIFIVGIKVKVQNKMYTIICSIRVSSKIHLDNVVMFVA